MTTILFFLESVGAEYNAAMPSSPFRLLAVLLLVVLFTTLVTPAPANADPLVAIGIAGAVIVVVIVVAYLIVASSKGGRTSSVERAVLLACAGDECRPLASPTALPSASLQEKSETP